MVRDGTAIQFLSGDTPWEGEPRMTGCLYVHPTSVDAVHDEIRGAIVCAHGVEDRPWGHENWSCMIPTGTS